MQVYLISSRMGTKVIRNNGACAELGNNKTLGNILLSFV